MEEGKRKKELDRFYLSLFTFDEIILRGLTAVKVRPFSGSVNRKKIVTPRSWTKRAGPGHARLSGTETGNLFGELHPVAFLVFPSVSPTYLCAPPECPMFLFRFFFISHFRGGMEFGSGSIFFEIGIFSASFIFISFAIIPNT